MIEVTETEICVGKPIRTYLCTFNEMTKLLALHVQLPFSQSFVSG